MRKLEDVIEEFRKAGEGNRHNIVMSLANALFKTGYTDENSLRDKLLEIWGQWYDDADSMNAKNDCRNTARNLVEQMALGGWQPPKEGLARKTETQIRTMVDSHDPYRRKWIEDLMEAHGAEITADVADEEIGRYDDKTFTEEMCRETSRKSLETVRKLTPLQEGEYLYYATPMMQKSEFAYLDHTYTVNEDELDMDDIWHPNPLCRKECKKEAIKRVRYICAEIDECMYEPLVASEANTYKRYAKMRREQMVFWNAVKDRLPIACMTSSGKKSVHVLMRVDTTLTEFEKMRPRLVSIYSALHIDRAGCTVSQLTRTPWGVRVFIEGKDGDMGLSEFLALKQESVSPDNDKRTKAIRKLMDKELDGKDIEQRKRYVVQQCLYLDETVKPMSLSEFIVALEDIEAMYVPQVDNLCEKNKMDGKVPYLTNEVFQDFLKLNTQDKKPMDIWLDEITRQIKLEGFRTDDANNLVNNLQDEWYEYFGTKDGMPSVEKWRGCIKETAVINRRNPVTDWLETLKWDNKDRISEACSILGMDGDAFARKLLHKWLLQCVALAYNDGVKPIGADGVLTLCGAQGIGKTSFFRHLVPKERQDEWWGEGISIDTSNKDDQMAFTEYWIAEMGEVDSTIGKEQKDLKAWITRAVDSIRAPYAEHKQKFRRHSSWCATVNDLEFLKDETGNRRWWTITIDHIDLERVSAFDSAQLWAQIWQEYDQSKDKDGCFRLTPDERKTLDQRNRPHMKQPDICDELRDKYDFTGERNSDGSYKDGQKETLVDIARYLYPDQKNTGRNGLSGLVAIGLRKMGATPTRVGHKQERGFWMPKRVTKEELAKMGLTDEEEDARAYEAVLADEPKAEIPADDPLFGNAPTEAETATGEDAERKAWLVNKASELEDKGMTDIVVKDDRVEYTDGDRKLSWEYKAGLPSVESDMECPF